MATALGDVSIACSATITLSDRLNTNVVVDQ
jgi:hypothetical protein